MGPRPCKKHDAKPFNPSIVSKTIKKGLCCQYTCRKVKQCSLADQLASEIRFLLCLKCKEIFCTEHADVHHTCSGKSSHTLHYDLHRKQLFCHTCSAHIPVTDAAQPHFTKVDQAFDPAFESTFAHAKPISKEESGSVTDSLITSSTQSSPSELPLRPKTPLLSADAMIKHKKSPLLKCLLSSPVIGSLMISSGSSGSSAGRSDQSTNLHPLAATHSVPNSPPASPRSSPKGSSISSTKHKSPKSKSSHSPSSPSLFRFSKSSKYSPSHTFDSNLKLDLSRLTGLSNLGNTCFMNSVFQNLCNLSPFVEFMLKEYSIHSTKDIKESFSLTPSAFNMSLAPAASAPPVLKLASEKSQLSTEADSIPDLADLTNFSLDAGAPKPAANVSAIVNAKNGVQSVLHSYKFKDEKDVERQLQITEPLGDLTLVLMSFLYDMKVQDEHPTAKFKVYSPHLLINNIIANFPQYKGNQQHDSYEFLRHLFEGLRREELARQIGPLKNYLGLEAGPVSKKTLSEGGEDAPASLLEATSSLPARPHSNKLSDLSDKLKTKLIKIKLTMSTFVDMYFQGETVSKVICSHCCAHSDTKESFLDLSLGIVTAKPKRLPPPVIPRSAKSPLANMAASSANTPPAPTDAEESQTSKQQQEEKTHVEDEQMEITTPVDKAILEGYALPVRLDLSNSKILSKDKKNKDGGALTQVIVDDGASRYPVLVAQNTTEMETKENYLIKKTVIDKILEAEACFEQGHTISSGDHHPDPHQHAHAVTALKPHRNPYLIYNPNDLAECDKLMDPQKVKQHLNTLLPNPQSAPALAANASSTLSLESSLFRLVSPDYLTGVNRYLCDPCNKKESLKKHERLLTNAIRQTTITKLPMILTLHLKRFENIGNRTFVKLKTEVSFPQILNMYAYCNDKCALPNGHTITDSNAIYTLSGTISHSGSLNSGHYVSYIHSKNKWYHISDESINQVSFEEVQKSQVTVMFYTFTGTSEAN